MKSIGTTPQQLWKAVALVLLLAACSETRNAPANSLPELKAELYSCLNLPTAAPRFEVTIAFKIGNDGSLLEKPTVSDATFLDGPRTRDELTAGVIAAFQRCLPLSVSKGLGAAVAGKLILLRIIHRPHERLMITSA